MFVTDRRRHTQSVFTFELIKPALTSSVRTMKEFQLEVSNDNTLSLRNIQRSHEGNYSCVVRNPIGSDHIVYQLYVQGEHIYFI